MSIDSKRESTPGYRRQGRTLAKRSRSWRNATLMDRNPVPTGVVTGPLRATLLRTIDAITCSGSGDPWVSMAGSPAAWTSHSIPQSRASTTRRVAAATSGPMPSPGISVTVGMAPGYAPFPARSSRKVRHIPQDSVGSRCHDHQVTQILTPRLIGREADLEQLGPLIEGVARGHGGFVLITGEAGIGKTRFVAAVLDSLRAAGV